MALSPLPYKWAISSFVTDASGGGWALSIDVKDGNNVTLRPVVVNVGKTQTFNEIVFAIEAQVRAKMELDAGGREPLLTALLGRNTPTER